MYDWTLNVNFPVITLYNSIKRIEKQQPRGFLRKRGLKKCSKFTGEHSCRSVISIKLLCFPLQLSSNHTSSVNLLSILRTLFPKNTFRQLLLWIVKFPHNSHLRTSLYSLCNSSSVTKFLWSVFSRMQTEYGEIRSIQSECEKKRTGKNSVFEHFSRSVISFKIMFIQPGGYVLSSEFPCAS